MAAVSSMEAGRAVSAVTVERPKRNAAATAAFRVSQKGRPQGRVGGPEDFAEAAAGVGGEVGVRGGRGRGVERFRAAGRRRGVAGDGRVVRVRPPRPESVPRSHRSEGWRSRVDRRPQPHSFAPLT